MYSWILYTFLPDSRIHENTFAILKADMTKNIENMLSYFSHCIPFEVVNYLNSYHNENFRGYFFDAICREWCAWQLLIWCINFITASSSPSCSFCVVGSAFPPITSTMKAAHYHFVVSALYHTFSFDSAVLIPMYASAKPTVRSAYEVRRGRPLMSLKMNVKI